MLIIVAVRGARVAASRAWWGRGVVVRVISSEETGRRGVRVRRGVDGRGIGVLNVASHVGVFLGRQDGQSIPHHDAQNTKQIT